MMKTSASANSTSYEGSKRRLKIWLVFVSLFMGWALYTMIMQTDRQSEAEQRLLAAEQKLQAAAEEADGLNQKIELLNDPEYIKEIARKEYNMSLPGEKPIQIARPKED
ncbi:septum formation initiator family protein [Paenibacillus tarimensis]